MQGDEADGETKPDKEWDEPAEVFAMEDETSNPPACHDKPDEQVDIDLVLLEEATLSGDHLLRVTFHGRVSWLEPNLLLLNSLAILHVFLLTFL